MDAWQIFLTDQLIGRVATIDVRLIVGISNSTSNLVMREKKLTKNARLYLHDNILEFIILGLDYDE